MDEIKISYDNQKFQSKPSGDMVRYISKRLARSGKVLSPKNVKRTVSNEEGKDVHLAQPHLRMGNVIKIIMNSSNSFLLTLTIKIRIRRYHLSK